MKAFITQNKLIKKIIIFLFWILVWQISAQIIDKEIFLPTVPKVCDALISEFGHLDFWQSVIFSLFRVLSGFVLGLLIAVLLAIACCALPLADELISPIMSVIKATPVASFIMLVYLFIDKSNVPSFIVILMVLPVVWNSIMFSYKNTPRKMLNYCKIYNIKGIKKLRYLYIPNALPYFISSAMTSLGLGWKAGIAAEVLCTPLKSIGRGIYFSKVYIETPKLYAYTVTVVFLSLILETVIKKIVGKIKIANSEGGGIG